MIDTEIEIEQEYYNKTQSLEQAKYWLLAMLNQFEKMKSLVSKMDKHQQLKIEEHFFAIALKHSIDWLKETERYNENIRNESKQYRKLINETLAIRIRNMREHYIEYFRGKNNSNKITRMEVNGMTLEMDASSTIVIDDKYLLGGLDIIPILKETNKLLGNIVICSRNLKSQIS